MNKRQLLKWTTPAIISISLPIHAQTSVTSISEKECLKILNAEIYAYIFIDDWESGRTPEADKYRDIRINAGCDDLTRSQAPNYWELRDKYTQIIDR